MKVSILAFDGCWALGVFSVTDFFRIVSLLEIHLGQTKTIITEILTVSGQEVSSASGHLVVPDGAIPVEIDCDLLVIPAIEGPRLSGQFSPDPGLLACVSEALSNNIPVLALTTGASFLAATGKVAHIKLATHWAYIRVLKKQFPDCQFMPHNSFLQTQNVYTTGSLNGCFDALLEIIALKRGDAFSQLCATHLLVSDPEKLNPILPGYRNHTDSAILKLQDWAESHYAEVITINTMAKQIAMSERTLKRRFLKATGLSPNEYLQLIRIDKAKKLLIATPLTIKEIAYQTGYENNSFFIRLFKKHTGATPAHWRKMAMQPS